MSLYTIDNRHIWYFKTQFSPVLLYLLVKPNLEQYRDWNNEYKDFLELELLKGFGKVGYIKSVWLLHAQK